MYNTKKNIFFLFALSLLVFPSSVFGATLGSLLDEGANLFKIFIPILLSLAVLVFFWGIVKFIYNAGDEKKIDEGKQLMLWGMVGLFVMVALWGIIGYIQVQVGLDNTTGLGTLPSMPNSIP